MVFPLTHRRTEQIVPTIPTDEFSEEFFTSIENRLIKSHIVNIKKGHNKLFFKGVIFRFVWNGWNLFNGISKGEFRIIEKDDKVYLSWKIHFFEYFIIALLFTIIPVLAGELMWKIIIAASIWLLFYGGNYIISVFRINYLMSNTVYEINYKPRFDLEYNPELDKKKKKYSDEST